MRDMIDRLTLGRVAVIGDVMLDCYLAGTVDRVSPEAPVPVLRVTNERSTPGGAANVAANLAALGVGVELVGLTGADNAHKHLSAILTGLGISATGLVADARVQTTRKIRVLGARQQIARIDYEDVRQPDDATTGRLLDQAKRAIQAADIVILSDYGKGVLSDHLLRGLIDFASTEGKRIVVDPKRRDFSAYRGASVVTPNRKELSEATGWPCETDAEAEQAARRAQESCGADILLTRSEKGMSHVPAAGPVIHLPTAAQDIFDVSGAGDTVVAVLAAALAVGIPFADAMQLSNHAAGIVVSKLGTAGVSREELFASLPGDAGHAADAGLIDLGRAVSLRRSWERQKLTVGVANGCFDLLHPGHVSLIRYAAAQCDRLIIALNTDASVRRLKGPARPVQHDGARAEVIAAIKGVRAVVLFDEDTPLAVIEALQPDVLVKGADYAGRDIVGADVVEGRGGRIALAPLLPDHSTTALVRAMQQAQPSHDALERPQECT